MGASGTVSSFSAVYGANLLKKEAIVSLFGIFVLLGAIVAGDKVIGTIGNGILPAPSMTFTITSIILLSCALSLFFANMLKVPQSTSQSTIFALMGTALYLNNLKADKLFFEIIPTWFILPIICFIISFLFGKLYYAKLKSSKIGFKNIASHPMWRFIAIASSCYVAFSIGSKNVANAAGPIASLFTNQLHLANNQLFYVVLISTLIVAPWFGTGSFIFGSRVIKLTSKEITELGPLGATFISFITATLIILAATTRGIPTSLVQLNTAAILAIGTIKFGFRDSFKKSCIKRIFIIWIVAPIIAFVLAYSFTSLADKFNFI